jgi:IstB-like ATP binding protein
VERHEGMELLAQLKLAGMRAADDEVVAAGVRAQLADNRARSIAYRMGVARFPVMKNLADQLVRVDLVILDELGYLPFPVSGGQMLFHLIRDHHA